VVGQCGIRVGMSRSVGVIGIGIAFIESITVCVCEQEKEEDIMYVSQL